MSQVFVEHLEARNKQASKAAHWTLKRSRWYKEMVPRWKTAWDHYEADMKTLRSATYLIQRVQGESSTQFDERRRTSDYLPLFSTIIDSLVGRILSIEPIKRTFQRADFTQGLGKVDELESKAREIWTDVDGKGTNYLTFIEDLAIRTIVFGRMWVYVKGVRRNKEGKIVSGPKAQLIEPKAIVRVKRDVTGNPYEVLVKSRRDLSVSMMEEAQEIDVYTLFTHEGTQEFWHVEDEEGNVEVKPQAFEPYGEEEGSFHYWKTRKKLQKRLPLFEVQLPMKRYVAHTLAEKNGVLFNQESERDNILRIACTPMFMFVGSDTEFKASTSARERGWNVLQLNPQAGQPHQYLSPDTSAAELRTKVIRDKITDFFTSGFRFYEDAVKGKQKTATEVDQDSATGEGSFLNTLAGVLDEAETQMMSLMEQIIFPRSANLWGQFTVSRPRSFSPINPKEEGKALADMFFGPNPVPIGEDGMINVVRHIAETHHIEFNEPQAREQIRKMMAAADKSATLVAQPPAPARQDPDPDQQEEGGGDDQNDTNDTEGSED